MNLDMSIKRDNCRLCNSKELIKVFPISPSQPVDGFRKHAHEYLNLPRFKTDLYMCKNCGHHQLLDVVDPKVLYGSYIYTSSSSPDLKDHFNRYSEYLAKRNCINKKSIVLDVGCNDGLFLKSLKSFSNNLFGIDPAPNILDSNYKKDYKLFSGFCNNRNIKELKSIYGIKEFNLITANNVFAHADNLDEMLSAISGSLSKEGYFCFEVSYIYDMVKSTIVDYIYHEHLSYHGIKSLKPFLEKHGLSIVDIERISTKGGSIRVLASKNKSLENKEIINSFLELENNIKCYSEETYNELYLKINKYKGQLTDFLKDNLNNSLLFSYGAAPTSIINSLLLGYEKYIGAYLDDNKLRQNLLTPNIFVPVLDPKIISEIQDSIIIIGAWRFKDLILPKIMRLNNKAKIIIPSLQDGIKYINFEN